MEYLEIQNGTGSLNVSCKNSMNDVYIQIYSNGILVDLQLNQQEITELINFLRKQI